MSAATVSKGLRKTWLDLAFLLRAEAEESGICGAVLAAQLAVSEFVEAVDRRRAARFCKSGRAGLLAEAARLHRSGLKAYQLADKLLSDGMS